MKLIARRRVGRFFCALGNADWGVWERAQKKPRTLYRSRRKSFLVSFGRWVGLLLGSEDGVFRGLGDREANLLALGDHQFLPGVGPEAHDHFSRRPVDELELADARDGVDVFGLFVGQFRLSL